MRTTILCALLALASCVPPESPPSVCPQGLDLAQPAPPDLAEPVPPWALLPCGDETDCPKEPEALFCATNLPMERCAHPAKCGFCRRPL